MAVLLHVTDLHLTGDGSRPYGMCPRERLERFVARVNDEFAYADAVVCTGDLTHAAQSASYDELQACIAGSAVPWRITIGNHDSRPLFLERFAAHGRGGFAQSYHRLAGVDLCLVDTHLEDSASGTVCDARLAWLADSLASATQPVALFMHHHPSPLGIRAVDAIALQRADELAAVLAPHRNRLLFIGHGHTHRTCFGQWQGIPVIGQRSLVHQASLGLRRSTRLVSGTPAFSVIEIADGAFRVHHEDLDASPALARAAH
ncbi:MAG: metallophosphoesterase [Burkholderiaceae bacterium]|nr:metallophosphoesterase [Burkholderiaceae bacterium]